MKEVKTDETLRMADLTPVFIRLGGLAVLAYKSLYFNDYLIMQHWICKDKTRLAAFKRYTTYNKTKEYDRFIEAIKLQELAMKPMVLK